MKSIDETHRLMPRGILSPKITIFFLSEDALSETVFVRIGALFPG